MNGATGEVMKSARATYADLEAVPEGPKVELVDGELWLTPQGSWTHQRVITASSRALGNAFEGPAGWFFLAEPELWLGRPVPNELVLVPDLAAWRFDRFVRPTAHGITVPPDLAVEVLSPSTHRRDRLRKLPVYAAAGVAWAWLMDPTERTVEVYDLREGRPVLVGGSDDETPVVLAPFDAPLSTMGWWPLG